MSQLATLRYGQSVSLVFPAFNFAGQASGPLLTPGTSPLNFGTEGYWLCYGVSATLIKPDDEEGSLPNGSDVNIQIFDVLKGENFFNYSQNYALNGAPIEHVAGKWGNPLFFNYPKVIAPGSRLMLYASQFSGNTPSQDIDSLMYVVLHCILTKEPVKNLVMQSFGRQMEDLSGEPFSFSTKFPFTVNPLLSGGQRALSSPMNSTSAFYIDAISVRNADLVPSDWIHSVDPRQQEANFYLSIKDAVSQSSFNQPDPIPLALYSGITGNRAFVPPTFFYNGQSADLITTVTNKTGADLSTNFEITYAGSVLKR